MGYNVRKPDHNGAKNGGGYWGKRATAKKQSSRIRREHAKKDIENQLNPSTTTGK